MKPSMEQNQQEIINKTEPHKQGRFFATIISYVFHPVFIPAMMTCVIYYFFKPDFVTLNNTTPYWPGMVIINTILFPLLVVFLLKRLRFIGSVKMDEPRDRIIPLIATMIFYFWAYQVFKSLQAPPLLRVFYLGNFYGIIAVFMINIFFKISMHTAAAGGAVGIMLLILLYAGSSLLIPFIIVLAIAGIIGTARLQLGSHIPLEIWLGYFAGIISQLCAYLFLK